MKLILLSGLLASIAISPAYAGLVHPAALPGAVLERQEGDNAASSRGLWSMPLSAATEQGDLDQPRLELVAHKPANAVALDNLGYKYQKGLGVGKDEAKARSLYQQAADAGLPSGIRNLGFMLENGLGGPKDLPQAAQLYERASAAGDATAANNLGLMYEEGRGVAASAQTAVRFYELAIRRGNVAASYNLGLLYVNGKGLPKDPAKAMSLFQKAARAGDADGMYEVGFSYDMGRSVPVDYVQAAKWIAKAIAAGSEFALKEMNEKHGNWEAPFRVALQKELAARGLYKGPMDGQWSNDMQAALARLAHGA